jgi:hypothetical protein
MIRPKESTLMCPHCGTKLLVTDVKKVEEYEEYMHRIKRARDRGEPYSDPLHREIAERKTMSGRGD